MTATTCTAPGATDASLAGTHTVVRWPERTAHPIRVRIDGPADSTDVANLVSAFRRWESVGLPLRFVFVANSEHTDITVHWIDQFSERYDGWTTVQWDKHGWIRSANMELARREPTGRALTPGEQRALVAHEAGHALGLPHLTDSTTLMWPILHDQEMTGSDMQAAKWLYTMHPGTVFSNGRPVTLAGSARRLAVTEKALGGCQLVP